MHTFTPPNTEKSHQPSGSQHTSTPQGLAMAPVDAARAAVGVMGTWFEPRMKSGPFPFLFSLIDHWNLTYCSTSSYIRLFLNCVCFCLDLSGDAILSSCPVSDVRLTLTLPFFSFSAFFIIIKNKKFNRITCWDLNYTNSLTNKTLQITNSLTDYYLCFLQFHGETNSTILSQFQNVYFIFCFSVKWFIHPELRSY